MDSAIKHDVALFDFLRGWSAVLVFFHHAAILGGGPNILTGTIGAEAVNVFMVASGFLIYFQCTTSSAYSHLVNFCGIRNFYMRRFFRIAPVYYISLLIALVFSTHLGHWREQIASVLPATATEMGRYYISNYYVSAIVHGSFVFGILPQYCFSTPLPDWSLGLEMQFYLIFPLLFAGYRKNFIVFFSVTLLAMLIAGIIVARLGIVFPMPSLLPMGFHNFAAGIALAHLMLNPSASRMSRFFIVTSVLAILLIGNRSLPIPLLFIFACWVLTISRSDSRAVLLLQRIFTHASSKFLADISYSLYILHLILMLPFFAWVLQSGKLDFNAWLLASLLLFSVTLVFAFICHRNLEVPGINIGKRLIINPARMVS